MSALSVFLLGCTTGALVCVVLSIVAISFFRAEVEEIVEWVAPEKIEPMEDR